MSLMDQYKKKLVSAEQAARVVKSGDWVEYGSFLGMVRACDKALAARKGELKDVKVRSCVTAYAPEVVLADPKGEVFTWVSWHFSGADRKFADKYTAAVVGTAANATASMLNASAIGRILFLIGNPIPAHKWPSIYITFCTILAGTAHLEGSYLYHRGHAPGRRACA